MKFRSTLEKDVAKNLHAIPGVTQLNIVNVILQVKAQGRNNKFSFVVRFNCNYIFLKKFKITKTGIHKGIHLAFKIIFSC